MTSLGMVRFLSQVLESGKFLDLKCNACGTITIPPKKVCRRCASQDLKEFKLAGNGEIKALPTIHDMKILKALNGSDPYTLVIDEGPWVKGNLSDIAPNHADMKLVGKRVKLRQAISNGGSHKEGFVMPLFNLCQDEV